MLVTLCNSNPDSPNAIRLGGRISSRDKHHVYDSTPALLSSRATVWVVNDLQTEKKHINVSADNFALHSNSKFYCQHCDRNGCEHIRSVLVHEDTKRKEKRQQKKNGGKSLNQLASFCIAGWGKLMRGSQTERAKFWVGVRVYANRNQVDVLKLSAEIMRITK